MQDVQVEDAAQIVRALAVHRFCRGQVRLIVEVLNPETLSSAVWDESQCSGIEVISPAKIHYKMLAHRCLLNFAPSVELPFSCSNWSLTVCNSCFIKGLYTFITNVFTSELKLKKLSSAHFLSEYFHGFDNEVYPMILPPTFHNLLFEEVTLYARLTIISERGLKSNIQNMSIPVHQVAEFIFTAFNVILFALDVPAINAETGAPVRRVLLHPKGHIIHPDDVGLVISWDLHTACVISKFDDRELPSGWFKQVLRHTRSKRNARARAEGRKILETVKNGWKSRGSVVGLTRDVWMSKNTLKQRFSDTLVARSANGHQELKSKLQSTIYRAHVQKVVIGVESSSEIKILDRSEAHIADKWDKAFSSGDMNDMDGLSLAKATEELLVWPPPANYGRPHPAVLERQEQKILESLQQRIISVVDLRQPHILICSQCGWPSNFYYFMTEIRQPGFPSPPVVILTPDLPNSYQWGTVGIFDDVFVLQGSPIYELDLMRGGVLHAGALCTRLTMCMLSQRDLTVYSLQAIGRRKDCCTCNPRLCNGLGWREE